MSFYCYYLNSEKCTFTMGILIPFLTEDRGNELKSKAEQSPFSVFLKNDRIKNFL
jgi:hypothetical protein